MNRMIKDKYDGINTSNLIEEQLDSYSQLELLNKFLKEDVKLVNDEGRKYFNIVKHLHGMFIVTIISILMFGFYGLIGLPFILFGFFLMRKTKNSVKWSIASLKTTIAMFRGNGEFCKKHDYLFDYYLDKIESVDIGELYEKDGA